MLEDIGKTISRLLPADLGEELQRNINAAVQGHVEQMNLASREQLEIQEKILKRTRERLTELEATVTDLENKLRSI